MQRMILAKLLYDNGIIATTTTGNDRLRFAQGIISFHDSVELSLGAIADHLNIPLKKNNVSLLDYVENIPKDDSERRRIPCSQQLKILNTLRNNIKHQGILPDLEANKHFPATITSYFNDICFSFFDLDFNQINLIGLISNQELKNLLIQAETALLKHEYELSFKSLSLVMYNILEKDFLQSRYTEDILNKVRKVVFPESESIELTVKLLEHGVDLKLYKRLHALIPYAGLNYETGENLFWVTKTFSHDGNWTEENARMCLNFVIDLALKFQKPETLTLQHYSKIYIDILEPLEDNLIIWAYTGTDLINSPISKSLIKGQRINGMVYDEPDRPDFWIIEDLEDPSFIGTVFKSQVKVTTVLKSQI